MLFEIHSIINSFSVPLKVRCPTACATLASCSCLDAEYPVDTGRSHGSHAHPLACARRPWIRAYADYACSWHTVLPAFLIRRCDAPVRESVDYPLRLLSFQPHEPLRQQRPQLCGRGLLLYGTVQLRPLYIQSFATYANRKFVWLHND